MNESKHTPGPWWSQWSETHKRWLIYAHQGIVAQLWSQGTDRPKPDADMLAAAPDLLEVLELAAKELNTIRVRDGAPQHVNWWRGTPIQTDGCTHEWWNELTEKCFAAIAKAKGEST